MSKKLTTAEVTEVLQVIISHFGILGRSMDKDSPVAGIIFTDDTYEDMRRAFGFEAQPYAIGNTVMDPQMEHGFVAHGMLMLRGTPVENTSSPLVN